MSSTLKKIFAFNFLYNLHFIGAVLVPFFTEWGGISFTQVMILQSWFSIWLFILEVPTGAVADHFGRKVSIALGAFTTATGVLIYGSFPSFGIFLIGELLFATGAALVSGADQALVYDSLKEQGREHESKPVLNRYISILRLAMMIAAPLGSLIASILGLRYSMLLMAVPMTLAGLVALLIREPKLPSDQPKESQRYLDTLKSGAGFLLNNKTARILVLDSVPIGVLTFFIIWLYQPLLTSLKIEVGYFGLVHAMMGGSQILVLLFYPRLEKLLGSKQRYLLWVSLLCGVGFITLGFLSVTAAVIPVIVLIAAFGMTRMDIFKNYLQKHIDSSERATVLSTVGMFRRFGSAALNPLIGIMVDWSLRYSFMIIGGGLVVLSLVSRVREDHLVD